MTKHESIRASLVIAPVTLLALSLAAGCSSLSDQNEKPKPVATLASESPFRIVEDDGVRLGVTVVDFIKRSDHPQITMTASGPYDSYPCISATNGAVEAVLCVHAKPAALGKLALQPDLSATLTDGRDRLSVHFSNPSISDDVALQSGQLPIEAVTPALLGDLDTNPVSSIEVNEGTNFTPFDAKVTVSDSAGDHPATQSDTKALTSQVEALIKATQS